MSASYIVIDVLISPAKPWSEILLAALSEVGYDSFEETSTGLKAYVQEGDFNEPKLRECLTDLGEAVQSSWTKAPLENKNWNEIWEANFKPIDVDGKLVVRAPFHEKTEKAEIIIQPQMSFGTGHHETTHLMLAHLEGGNYSGQKVLDMGCGTGVLGICCELRGATEIVGIDIDEWSVENTRDNMKLNDCVHLEIRHGGAEKLGDDLFDLVIANINRNILMTDMEKYAGAMKSEATILLSGFYTGDCQMLIDHCAQFGLSHLHTNERHGWGMMEFRKGEKS